MNVEKIGAPMGAVVSGIDVRSVSDAGMQELRDCFSRYHVLAFPDQSLTPDEQLGFARRWGEPVRHPYSALDDHPEIIELRNRGKAGDVNQHWHTDMSYNASPPKLTMLYALETPEIGGDTAFSNQVLAYRELSSGLRDMLVGLSAEHSAVGLAKLYGADPGEAPSAVHPVVRTHDENGLDALYVCRAFTRRFVGWSREDSRPILEYLFEQAVRPEYQIRHRWRPGDLVMWDNRCVQHFAVHDHDDAPRRIHRLQVQ